MSKYEVSIPEYSEFSEILKNKFSENKLDKFYNESNCQKFYTLTKMLLETNSKMNLTAIRDVEGTIVKHYCDCLFIADMISKDAKMLDIGCGGGFPTLPVALVRDDVKIVSLDSTAKKLGFVSDVAKELGLNVTTLCGRAEEIAGNSAYRESFDVVTARAVSSLDILSELCIPFVKLGGRFIAMKGSSGNEEFEKAKKGIGILGGGDIKESVFMLEDMKRYIYVVEKKKKTPSLYPRAYAKICKTPL